MIENRNQKTMTVKITRRDMCDILLALTALSIESNNKKWDILHDKLKEELVAFDKKLDDNNV